MSNPPNSLDKYRSHSYHHILIAANNTEIIRQLSEPKPGEGTNFLSSVAYAKLGQEIIKDSGAYLVFDTRKTSDFMMDNLKFTTHVGGNTSPSDHTIIGSKIEMTIIDPSGIGFFNYMKWLCDEALQTDITGVTFLLHTMFIGHTDRGQTEVVDSISIAMIMAGDFNLTQFGTDGGRYEVSFCAISGMLGTDIELYTNLWAGEAINFKFQDSLLGNAIQALENQLNIASRHYYFAINPIDKPVDGPVTTSQVQPKNPQTTQQRRGRLVQYMITIPEHWFYFTVGSPGAKVGETDFASTGGATVLAKIAEQNQKQVDKQNADTKASIDDAVKKDPKAPAHGYFVTSINMKVQDVLWSLLSSCDAVNKMANLEAKTAGISTIFKTLTSITSDKDVVLVHFDIVEFALPDTNQSDSDISSDTEQAEFEKKKQTYPPGAIIFDYIFSGKNEDILHFDIKVNNMMLGLFSKSNVSVSAVQQISGQPQTKKDDSNKTQVKPALYKLRPMQPVVAPPPSFIQYTNNAVMVNQNQTDAAKQFQNKQEFHKSLSDLTAASLQPVIKIRGNPDLYKSYVVDSIPPHVQLTESVQAYLSTENIDFNKLTAWDYGNGKKPKAKGGATIVTAHLDHRKWVKALIEPVQKDLSQNAKYKPFVKGGMYAKVNVYGPADYPFAQANAGDTTGFSNKIRTQLFYDGFYFVSAIHSEFSTSSFTQDLSLHTCDLYGEYTTMQNPNVRAAT